LPDEQQPEGNTFWPALLVSGTRRIGDDCTCHRYGHAPRVCLQETPLGQIRVQLPGGAHDRPSLDGVQWFVLAQCELGDSRGSVIDHARSVPQLIPTSAREASCLLLDTAPIVLIKLTYELALSALVGLRRG